MRVGHCHTAKSRPSTWPGRAVGHCCSPGSRLGLSCSRPSLEASFRPRNRGRPQPYLYMEAHALVRAAQLGPPDLFLGIWNRSGQSLLPWAPRLSGQEHFVGEQGHRQEAWGIDGARRALGRRPSCPDPRQVLPQPLRPEPASRAGGWAPRSAVGIQERPCTLAEEDISSFDQAMGVQVSSTIRALSFLSLWVDSCYPSRRWWPLWISTQGLAERPAHHAGAAGRGRPGPSLPVPTYWHLP